MTTTLLAAIVFLGVLILVHELGHLLAAWSVGIKAERFSIGFGPKRGARSGAPSSPVLERIRLRVFPY